MVIVVTMQGPLQVYIVKNFLICNVRVIRNIIARSMPELHDQPGRVRVQISSARYWLGTCFCEHAPAQLPDQCNWIKGQREKCPTTGR